MLAVLSTTTTAELTKVSPAVVHRCVAQLARHGTYLARHGTYLARQRTYLARHGD